MITIRKVYRRKPTINNRISVFATWADVVLESRLCTARNPKNKKKIINRVDPFPKLYSPDKHVLRFIRPVKLFSGITTLWIMYRVIIVIIFFIMIQPIYSGDISIITTELFEAFIVPLYSNYSPTLNYTLNKLHTMNFQTATHLWVIIV